MRGAARATARAMGCGDEGGAGGGDDGSGDGGGGEGGGDGGGGGNHPDGGDRPDGGDADADGGENSGGMTYGSRGTRKRSPISKPFGSRTPSQRHSAAARKPCASWSPATYVAANRAEAAREPMPAIVVSAHGAAHMHVCSSMPVTRLDQDHLRARDPRDESGRRRGPHATVFTISIVLITTLMFTDVARGGENTAAQRLLPYTAAQRMSPWRKGTRRTQGDAQKARERERELQRAHSHRARRVQRAVRPSPRRARFLKPHPRRNSGERPTGAP